MCVQTWTRGCSCAADPPSGDIDALTLDRKQLLIITQVCSNAAGKEVTKKI